MLTVLTRRHRFFAIVAFTAVSFALAQQAPGHQRWTNDAGKIITAQFIRIEGANVVLRLADGREVPYPLAKLNAASQQQAHKLAAAREPKVKGAPKEKALPAPTVETPPDPEQILLAAIPPPTPRDATQPLVGAIRWDAWTGGWVTDTMQKTLGPAKYHERLPWFADVKGDGQVKIDGGRQIIMDTEIAWAASAGLDYWAFLLYPESDVMSASLAQYLKSPRRKDIGFCVVLHNALKVPNNQWPQELKRMIKLMKEPGYVTVLDGRPLVYEFEARSDEAGQKRFDEFRAAAKEAKLNPYCVYMGWNPAPDWKAQAPRGFDAVSHYARASDLPRDFAGLVRENEEWMWQSAAKEQVPYIPLVTTGWNKEPRKGNPVSWEVGHSYLKQTVFIPPATAEEIAKHLQNALNFVKENPKTCLANALIMYAWNEHDEGGWLVPTWTSEGKPNAARLDAIRPVLRPLPDRTEPRGDELTYLDNGAIKVGANLSRGGSIGYLADTKKGGNVVHVHDYGRWIGQHKIVYEFEYVLVLDTLEAIRKEAHKLRPKSPLPDYRFASDRRHWWFVNAADTGYPIRGHLRVKTEGDDPHLFGPEGFWAAKDAPTVYVRAAHHTKNAVAELFWETADKPGFDVNQSVRFAVVPDGKYRTYAVDLSAAPTYRGLIRRLRFDPVATGAPGEFVDIEFISAKKN